MKSSQTWPILIELILFSMPENFGFLKINKRNEAHISQPIISKYSNLFPVLVLNKMKNKTYTRLKSDINIWSGEGFIKTDRTVLTDALWDRSVIFSINTIQCCRSACPKSSIACNCHCSSMRTASTTLTISYPTSAWALHSCGVKSSENVCIKTSRNPSL